ncbi:MAG TPA: AtpZ/AtpI family protein [Terracidiphilus sp.]|nr:AtpZ/AtpI family protein [Terracidiphilus sp.]
MPYHNPIPERKGQGGLAGAAHAYVQVEKIAQIAIALPCAVLIGWLGGAWLDSRLHQSWIGIVGFVLGCVAGMTTAIRMAMALVADPKKNSGKDADTNSKS